MPEVIRIHLDENCDSNLATELRSLGFDVTTSYEVGLKGAVDWKQLGFANAEGRVMVSHDYDMIKLHKAGVAHHGIIYRKIHRRTIALMIEGIVRASETYDRDSMIGVLVKLTGPA
jgi:uncharacterized protein with PIN domain